MYVRPGRQVQSAALDVQLVETVSKKVENVYDPEGKTFLVADEVDEADGGGVELLDKLSKSDMKQLRKF